MVNKTHYLSADKLEELKLELTQLKTVERRKIAENLEYAKSLGDLSENAEYHEARDKQADVEDRILELEDIIKNSQIIKKGSGEVITIGSKITALRDGKNEAFYLVGAEEADMLAGRISHESPLGEALLGHKKGDNVVVITPRGEINYKIIDIE